MANLQRNVKYINKDFSSLKQSLLDYAKTYFPTTYNDFSPASPGMMFMEMAAYVGDVLSYYQDTQLQENFIKYAKEKENLYALAYMLGYRPKVTTVSNVKLDVFQLLPSMPSASVTVPDWNYALVIEPGTILKSSNRVDFYIKDRIDFSFSSSLDPTELTVYSIDGSNNPEFYLLKKQAQAFSGTEKTTTFTVGAPERFKTLTLTDDNIIEITSVVDSDGNEWVEVPYLAQETIFEEISNAVTEDPNFQQYSDSTPYLLRLKRVQRRFVSRFKSNNQLELQFGVGNEIGVDEIIIPNPENVGLGIPSGLEKLTTAYDPSNFLYTKTYGIAPSNTTLTVTYLVGGGVSSNVGTNSINEFSTLTSNFKFQNLDGALKNTVINSLGVTNPEASTGGADGDSVEDIRLNSLSAFPSQLRAVTLNDYLVRTYSLPSKFGVISKAYIVQDSQIDVTQQNNPLSLSLYVLSEADTLTPASLSTKQNLKTYLSQYRMLTDAINIKDAYIINIGVNFEILTLPRYSSQEVILECIEALKDHFDIDKWQINQPIILSEIRVLLDRVKGVQTVKKVEIVNKSGESLGYSKYGYDIKSATQNDVIYPSLDPSIFEVKFPNTDISGKVVTF